MTIQDHYAQLLNGRVVAVLEDENPSEVQRRRIYGYRIEVGRGKSAKKYNVWILRDPEGNGPGHLDIEEI